MRIMLAAMTILVLGCPLGRLPPGGGIACTLVFVYGLTVDVADEDGAPVEGATLTLTERGYVERLEEAGSGSYIGAGERAGTYSLTIEADGFFTQTIGNIVIHEDECHVIPVAREVVLLAS